MSANSIDAAFVRQFEADVHLAYQRMGAKLLGTWRRKLNVRGRSTTFQKIGAGVAGKKGRNSQVPIMNLAHEPVECPLEDWYAGEFVDKLDELKIEHDERQSVARSIAAALGRRSDQLGIDKLDTASKETASAAGGITKPKVQEAYTDLGNNDVPDDGERYMPVSPKGWTDLMDIEEFSRVNYVPVEELPWQGSGMTAKRWFSFFVMQHSGLTIAGAVRSSYTYHKTAIGHASGSEVYLDITWQGKEQAHLLVGGMSQGACLIDDRGVYRLRHTES